MLDWWINRAYVLAGAMLLVTLIFGDETPLSFGWTMSVLDGVARGLWAEAPMVVILALVGGGVAIGRIQKARELQAEEASRAYWEEARKKVMGEPKE